MILNPTVDCQVLCQPKTSFVQLQKLVQGLGQMAVDKTEQSPSFPEGADVLTEEVDSQHKNRHTAQGPWANPGPPPTFVSKVLL